MKNTRLLTIFALVASLSGCAAFNTVRSDRHTTMGQEMLDLKKAQEAGIITEAQYHEQIEYLMNHKNGVTLGAKVGE